MIKFKVKPFQCIAIKLYSKINSYRNVSNTTFSFKKITSKYIAILDLKIMCTTLQPYFEFNINE